MDTWNCPTTAGASVTTHCRLITLFLSITSFGARRSSAAWSLLAQRTSKEHGPTNSTRRKKAFPLIISASQRAPKSFDLSPPTPHPSLCLLFMISPHDPVLLHLSASVTWGTTRAQEKGDISWASTDLLFSRAAWNQLTLWQCKFSLQPLRGAKETAAAFLSLLTFDECMAGT